MPVGSWRATVITDVVLCFEMLQVGGLLIFVNYLWSESNIPRDPLH
jgi:hypothetical protein